MIQRNFMNVSIPLHFDFHALGIFNKEDIVEFLQKMCQESINQPIIRDEKPVGIVKCCNLNTDMNGLVCDGIIWCHIGNELIASEDGLSFGAVVVD